MSTASKSTKKPAVALSKVPSVKELCEKLGFQHASLKDTTAFMDSTHAWRKTYKTSDGVSGTVFLLWNDMSVQSDLHLMAERFLQDRDNGNRFWSPTRSWNHGSDVHYPDDKARIIELLKQLFWKQNRYAANNNNYNHKTESRDASRDKTTPLSHIPDMASKTKAIKDQHQGQGASAPSVVAQSSIYSNGNPGPKPHVTGRLQPSVETDIFEIPDDDDANDTVPPRKSSTLSPKHARTPRVARARDALTPRKRKPIPEGSLRRTDRKREARKNSYPRVSIDELDQALKSPPAPIGNTSPSAGGGNIDQPKRVPYSSKDSHETNPESLPISKASFVDTLPPESFVAPTAPMITSNQTMLDKPANNPSQRFVRESTAELLQYAEFFTPVPQAQSSKEVPLQGKGKDIAPPELDNEAQSGLLPTLPHQLRRSLSSDLSGRIDPRQAGSSATLSYSGLQSDGTLLNSPIRADAEVATAASMSGESRQARRSPMTVQSAQGVKRSSPSDRDASIPPLFNKRVKTMGSVDFGKGETSPDPFRSILNNSPSWSTPTGNTPPKPRSKVQVPLWIITREPRYTEERWHEGRFQGTTISDFFDGLSKATQRNHIEKVKLTLRTPNFDTKITVLKDDEEVWISAKKKFVDKLKEATAEAKSSRSIDTANFEILVEPFYEESALKTDNDGEDDLLYEF